MRKILMSVATALTLGVASLASIPEPTHSAAAAPAVASEATLGSWTAPFTPAGPASRVIGVHSILMHTGDVLVFGNLRPTQGYVYNPDTGAAVETDPPVDIECAGVTPLEDGRILVVGGHGKSNTGIVDILLFDPLTKTWTPQPTSPLGRYYPTTTRLPNGTVLISGGFTQSGADNTNVEVYTPPPAGSSMGSMRVVGQHRGGLYPHQWVLPNGKVLELASGRTSLLDPATWTWTALPKPLTKHPSGEGGVLLPGPPAGSTTATLIGGGTSTSAVTGFESFDASTAAWTPLPSLPQPRTHMSPVLAPDGSIIGIGGNSNGNFAEPQFAALSYGPGASGWTTLAPQVERRGYHSTAVLLSDGRVFSAGDTGTGGGGNTAEIFSPPYLFQGPRPAISSAPSQVGHGASFTIGTADLNSRAVLMSPGAATHTVDMSARHVELAVTSRSAGLTVRAPSGTVALTGWYMLFLVDSAGIPSIGKWIHVG